MNNTPRTHAMDDYSELQRENEEQARLLGASAERECDLRGKVERLERELAALIAERDQLRSDCENETKWAAHYLAESIAVKGERDQLRAVRAEAELATAQGEVKRLTKQIKDDNRSYGCELRDPYGTIWEQATKDHDRAEKAERELAALRESYAYAEISLPAELIPATRAASKEEAK